MAELLAGIGLLLAPVRRAAGVGLIVLLVVVLPANVQMLLNARARGVSWWGEAILWLRLPLQLLLILWVERVSRAVRPTVLLLLAALPLATACRPAERHPVLGAYLLERHDGNPPYYLLVDSTRPQLPDAGVGGTVRTIGWTRDVVLLRRQPAAAASSHDPDQWIIVHPFTHQIDGPYHLHDLFGRQELAGLTPVSPDSLWKAWASGQLCPTSDCR